MQRMLAVGPESEMSHVPATLVLDVCFTEQSVVRVVPSAVHVFFSQAVHATPSVLPSQVQPGSHGTLSLSLPEPISVLVEDASPAGHRGSLSAVSVSE